MNGNGGNDILDGGAGDDIAIGGGANDALSGENGADLIDGGAGNDLIRGGRAEYMTVSLDVTHSNWGDLQANILSGLVANDNVWRGAA